MRTENTTPAARPFHAAAAVLLLAGCAPVQPPAVALSPAVMNAIAACSGGAFSSASAELKVIWQEKGGAFVRAAEVSAGGPSPFRFGDLEGDNAVAMYNQYVQCINENRVQASTSGPEGMSRSEGVLVSSCYISPSNASQNFHERFYSCALRNTNMSRRRCILVVRCMNDDEQQGFVSQEFTIESGDIRSMAGFVVCTGLGARQAAYDLTCGTN